MKIMKTSNMKNMIVITALAASIAGCATTDIKTDKLTNPPPSVAFNQFNQFEMDPIVLADKYKEHKANIKAMKKIQENLDLRFNALDQAWTKTDASSVKTLALKPRIKQIKFVSGGARALGSVFAGKSAVVMSVEFIDKENRKIVAKPEFYQHTGSWSGAYTFGAADNIMLVRITEVIEAYLKGNYAEAVGGPTGKPAE